MIKKIFFTTIVGLSSFILTAQPKMVFKNMTHNFGIALVKDGALKYKFTFFNAGNAPLKISNVLATSNNVGTDWKKGNIAPKDSGYIYVTYDPQGKTGSFLKEVSVLANNAVLAPTKLFIKGEVIEKDVFNLKLRSQKVDSMFIGSYPKLLGSKKVTTILELSKDTITLIQGKKKNIYKVISASYDDDQKTVFYTLKNGQSFQYRTEYEDVIFVINAVRNLVYTEGEEIE